MDNKENNVVSINYINNLNTEISLELDLQNLKTSFFQIKLKDFITLFSAEEKNVRNNLIQKVIVFKNDKKTYYCFNCAIQIYFPSEGEYCDLRIKSIDYIFTDCANKREEIKVDSFTLNLEVKNHLEYLKINFLDFSFNEDIQIKISRETRKNDKGTSQFFVKITAESRVAVLMNELENICRYIYGLFVLYLGRGIKILERSFFINSQECQYYILEVDKYNYIDKQNSIEFCIHEINDLSLNKTLLNKWIEIENDISLVFDVYLFIKNSDIYNELKLSLTIQILEGFYKSYICKKDLELWKILENVFVKSDNIKDILSSSDKNQVIYNKQGDTKEEYLYKLINHRNYFSHFNILEKKDVFVGKENNYALYKTDLALRMLILNTLNLIPDNTELINFVERLNEFIKEVE